ncbi:hypothetical protein BDV29DRAFT_159230 [Aspergillus leporis]|uniref:Uncharacterized protein n=1 Tax=Aspergillus leporis TaxID=41062 RepID=A0A5N5WT81_9EURO|nr:hypothetical protein BDV29DRAFT_159230 [Aspergillus leporis]
MEFFSTLLLLFAALVVSAPTSGPNGNIDPATGALLQSCSWDWNCLRQFLCCKGRCYRTGDCRNIRSEPEGPTTTDPIEDTPASPIEGRWQKDCQHASECGHTNWWVCCNKKCVERTNDQHVPVCNTYRSLRDGEHGIATPNHGEPSETPDSVAMAIEDTHTEAPEEAPVEDSWQKDCRHSSECGNTNWWVCCNKKCVKRANDQHVPVCNTYRDLEDNLQAASDEAPVESVEGGSETGLSKRRYRAPEDRTDKGKDDDKPSDEHEDGEKTCSHWWECGTTGENLWACCNNKCLKWFPGATPWVRPRCLKQRSFPSTRLMRS